GVPLPLEHADPGLERDRANRRVEAETGGAACRARNHGLRSTRDGRDFGQDLAERRRELFGVGGEEGASARRRAAGDGDAVEGTARLERGIAEVRRVVAEAGAVREVAVGEVVARALRAG